MKRIISLLMVLTMILGCFSAIGITASADGITIVVDKTNTSVTGSNDGNVVACKDFDTWAKCNPNWSLNFQLRPTGKANEYTVVAIVKDLTPAIQSGEGSTSISITADLLKKYSGFSHVNGDIYMIINGSENYSAHSVLAGYTATLTNVDVSVNGACANATATISADLASMAGGLINNNNAETKLVTSVANLQVVSASEAVSVISGNNAPASILVNANGADLGAIFDACIENAVLPTVQIDNATQKTAVIDAMKAKNFYDVNVISADASLLGDVYNTHNFVRTGLIYNIPKSTLTGKEADAIRKAVRSAPASFVVVESGNANKQTMYEIQKLGVPVWVKIASAKGTDNFNIEVTNAVAAGANAVISSSASDVTSLINKHFYTDKSMTRTPVAVAHRGDVTAAAENTIEAFWGAYNNGADYFELDVRITSDNKIVVFHDGKLNDQAGLTTYTGTKSISQMTLAEVQSYKYTTGEKIPSFEEVLKEFANVDINIFVEFKGGGDAKTVELTANLIKQYNMQHKVVVISSSTKYLEHTNTYFNNEMTTSFVYGTYSLFAGTPYTKIDSKTEAYELLALILPYRHSSNGTMGPFYSDVAYGWMGQATTDRGITLSPWTYESNNNANIGFFSNVDTLTTDVTPYFTNMVKYVTASDFVMSVGQNYSGGALTATTYGNKTTDASADNTVFSVVSGDAVKVVDGKLTAMKEGTAKVLMGYKTATATGSAYVVYSEIVDVTVDNSNTGALTHLIAMAETMTVKDFSEGDLITLRQLHAKALELVNSDDPDGDEVAATASALAELLAQRKGTAIVPAVSYTAPAPNYYKWDSAANAPSTELNTLYSDDGKRLVDGVKNNPAGNSAAYSVWQNIDVNIDVDLGKNTSSNIYNAYFACHEWGVAAPDAIAVSYSDDGINWTKINAECVIETVNDTSVGKTYDEYKDDGLWSLYKYTVKSDVDINARYIRFFIDIKGNFIWVDEVEVEYAHGDEVQGEYVYVTGFNSTINSGDSCIFTPDFGEINTETANHDWTANIVAKWDAEENAYIVKSVSHGVGADTAAINLASDEILLAVHAWEATHPDSVLNKENAEKALVGQKLVVYGLDIQSKALGIAPYVRFVDVDHVCAPDGDWKSNAAEHWHVCECGQTLDRAEHTAGDFVDVEGGGQAQYCTVCGYEMAYRDIEPDGGKDEGDDPVTPPSGDDPITPPSGDDPVNPPVDDSFMLGDVNKNSKIDMTDYILLKRAYFGTYTFDADQNKRGDINKNDKIDMTDYILLKRVYFGTYTIK